MRSMAPAILTKPQLFAKVPGARRRPRDVPPGAVFRGAAQWRTAMSIPLTISERIVEIIRRDLKLDAELELTPDTVLFGGDLDLDSLDALLLVQSIEKDFGIKVPTDSIGPEMFANMRTLTDFVTAQTQTRQTA